MQLWDAFKRTKCYATQLVDFWISLVGLASISVVVWYFDPIGDLLAQIVLTLLAASMSLLFLLIGLSNNKERGVSRWVVVGFSVFSIASLLILLGDRIDAPGLVINGASLLLAFPALWLYWKVAHDERLLKVWFIPIVVAASVSLVPPITPAGVMFDLLLLPLPVVSYACVAWALATKLSLTIARKAEARAIRGPAMQSLTMLLLSVPLVALTMLAVDALRFGDVWVAVSGAVVSIMFGSAVSVPFRQLLLNLGCLSSNLRCECGCRVAIQDKPNEDTPPQRCEDRLRAVK